MLQVGKTGIEEEEEEEEDFLTTNHSMSGLLSLLSLAVAW
jgi:hypothetical protein